MKIKTKSNTLFTLSRETHFSGKTRSLRVRSGTISKFNAKAGFGTIPTTKKGKKSVSIYYRKKTTEQFFKKKTNAFTKKEYSNRKIKEPSKPLVKASGKVLKKQTIALLDQEEDTEGVHEFSNQLDSSKAVFKTGKQLKGFMTKNEKFSSSVTAGKLDDLRFSSKGNPSTKSGTKHASKSPIKSKEVRNVYQTSSHTKKKIMESITQAVAKLTTSSPYGWLVAGIGLFVVVIVLLVMVISNQSVRASDNGSIYVAHWDGKDAYHSSLLAQRYGITAEQIDGFIRNEGYSNVDDRATGQEFLRLQSISGIDVRMLVAFAQMESSYGTAGVAKQFPKANIFGYGAFDNDPNQGASWDNTRAVKEMRSTQIDTYGNRTIAIMDQRAEAYHNNTLKPGEFVYWTSLNAGKPRAAIAEKLDKWIDEHGGTPEPPGGYGSSNGGVGIAALDKLLGQSVSGEFGGESGQCYAVTAYYAHSITPDIYLRNGIKASEIGNDYPWSEWKWTVVKNPNYKDIQAGDIINFHAGATMGTWVADSLYGHTGVVGKVLGDNKFILYDQNPGPLKTWTVTYVAGGISSVIHPPK